MVDSIKILLQNLHKLQKIFSENHEPIFSENHEPIFNGKFMLHVNIKNFYTYKKKFLYICAHT